MDSEVLALTEELSNAYEELSLLYDLSDALSSLSPADVLKQSVEKAYDFIHPAECVALLLENNRLMIRGIKSARKGNIPPHFSLKTGEGVIGRAAQTGKSMLVNEAKNLSAKEKKAGWRRILAAPLSGKDKIYGVLAVVSGRKSDSFFSQQKKLLTALARQTGLSLENAYLIENLKKENQTTEAILTNVTDAVLAFNENMQCVLASGEALHLLHREKEDVVQKHAKEIFRGDAAKILRFLRSLSPMQPMQKEFTLSLNGEVGQFRAGGLTLLDSLQKPYLKILVLHNVTDLVRTQKIIAWQDIARKLAHELKNPLTPIRLNAEALQDKDLQRAPNFKTMLVKFTDVIIKEVDRLKNLVDEFHSFGRLPQPKLQDVNLHALLDEVLELYHFSDNIKFVKKWDEKIPLLFADPDQLKQVFINLIKNAMEAMPQGGGIHVETRVDGRRVIAEVRDTGTGMPKEVVEKIFDPYYTTKKTGTGLGLSLVHRIITDHRGEIKVTSKSGKGTTFTIALPMKER